MSIPLNVNGQVFDYPEVGDQNWGPDATDWASAVTTGMLQKAGGLFQLLDEVDFGSGFGIKSLYYKSRTANPASSGQVRFARADVLSWRNQANSANLDLSVDASNNLLFNGAPVVGGITVADTATIDLTLAASELTADIVADSITNAMISSSAAIAYSKLNLSGSIVNADVSNSAAIAYSKLALGNSITNSDINASAAIAFLKLEALTSAHILVGSAGNVATDVAVSGDISISNTGITAYTGTVPLNKGGTGQTTKSAAFDALSPMTTGGDVIYGGASGIGTRLANGSNGQVLTSSGGTSAPTWQTVSGNATVLKAPTIQIFSAALNYTFTVTAANATVGATYTNNGQTFTVIYTIAGGTTLVCSGTGAPAASGTLTKSAGTGDATITFASVAANGTYVLPSPAPLYLKVRAIGGGGGGGGSCTNGNNTTAGSAGGNTAFGTSLVTTNGGGGATQNTAGATLAAGGSVTINSPAVAVISQTGSSGGSAGNGAGTAVIVAGGNGGSSPMFVGGGPGGTPLNTGRVGTSPGAGGGGGGAPGGGLGGYGGASGGYAEAIISSPSSSYTFTVGAAGANGAAGTGGHAGASGAVGIIIVEEHYQ